MLVLGHDPIAGYIALFKGAFKGNLSLGTTLQKFIPLLLTSLAFATAAKVNVFNVGVEGELYLGALASAWLGYQIQSLPKLVAITICIVFAVVIGMMWATIPAFLKANWGVNEICVTILMNYIAMYFTSYVVNNRFSANTGVAQSPPLPREMMLTKLLKPSQLTTAIFIALITAVVLIWVMRKTKLGYQIRTVGQSEKHAEYAGIKSKKTIVIAMMISGALGGLAGALEIFGVFGYFLDGFSAGLAFDGMLVALIVKNDLFMIPVLSLFVAVLKSGALGMERSTGIPKSVIDMIIAIFIIFATMETLFAFIRKRKKKVSTSNSKKMIAES